MAEDEPIARDRLEGQPTTTVVGAVVAAAAEVGAAQVGESRMAAAPLGKIDLGNNQDHGLEG